MKNFFLDVLDIINYDLLNKPLPKFSEINYKQDFILKKENGGYWLESKEFPGLVASGKTLKELREALFDSILTYFDVPRAVAKRLPDQLELRLPNGRVIRPKSPTLKYLAIKTAAA